VLTPLVLAGGSARQALLLQLAGNEELAPAFAIGLCQRAGRSGRSDRDQPLPEPRGPPPPTACWSIGRAGRDPPAM
jgi:hypothetical protein